MVRRLLPASIVCAVVPLVRPSPAQAALDRSPVLQAMEAELLRSAAQLKDAGEAPMHFLAYRVYDESGFSVRASYGALEAVQRDRRGRTLDVELRVGTPQRDSTHKLRGGGFEFDFGGAEEVPMPVDDDPAAIRTALWLATDAEFKAAQKAFAKVKANLKVKVEEEDPSDDFSSEARQVHIGPRAELGIDKAAWEKRVRQASALYRDHPAVHTSSVDFSAEVTRRFLVSSEGSRIQDERVMYRVMTSCGTTADDGMQLHLFDSVEATDPSELPDDARLAEMVTALAESLTALRAAPVALPYAGPAILRSKAAAVFFHEIFGHRIEGHRQKDEEEGRTFAKKVGERITSELISVVDDPTLARLGDKALNGFYQFDDEGVPAQSVTLIDQGVLKGFLMGRSPVRNFPKSNGHGRCSPGFAPCARQGNLIVRAARTVSYPELRAMLLAELKKQNKPFGLVFDEIAGGFTVTQTYMPQSFKLLPLRVFRVHADGSPDELLRGVDIVGTPLATIERIVAAADDVDTFNGTCGAESGWVPVSASSPSLLVGTIEVERQEKGTDRPPLLPSPRHDSQSTAAEVKK